MFMTGEYRRGLIRVSLTAAPRRGRLLAAKAVVIGAVGFVAGLVAATLTLAVATPIVRRTGIPVCRLRRSPRRGRSPSFTRPPPCTG